MPTTPYMESRKRERGLSTGPFLERIKPEIFFGSAVGVGFLSLLFYAYCESPGFQKMLLTFLKEGGFALVVAGLIGLTIDLYSRKRHEILMKDFTDSMSQEPFKAAFKRHVPDCIVDHVFKHVFKHKFFRTRYISKYKLNRIPNPTPGGPDLVELNCKQEVTIRNIGLVEDYYSFEMYLDLTFLGNDASASVKSFTIPLDQVDLIGQNLVPYLEPLTDRVGYKLSYLIKIAPGKEKTLFVKFIQRHPLQGQEYLCTMIPCGHLELHVSDPGSNFFIAATSLHPENEILAADLNDPIGQEWHVDDLLPGHGICFSWRPKPKTPKTSRSKGSLPKVESQEESPQVLDESHVPD